MSQTKKQSVPVYECAQCGACCRALELGDIHGIDILREPRLREVTTPLECEDDTEAWARPYTINGRETGWLMSECPLVDVDNRCEIHATRPNMCVCVRAGDEDCQEARYYGDLPPLEPKQRSRKKK